MSFFFALISTSTLPQFIKKTWPISRSLFDPKLGHVFPADINECQPTSDCMQQCTNTQGSYTCSCYQYFTQDPNNWKNCTGNFILLFNYWRKQSRFNIWRFSKLMFRRKNFNTRFHKNINIQAKRFKIHIHIQMIFLYFVYRSPTLSNCVVLCLCTSFHPGCLCKLVSTHAFISWLMCIVLVAINPCSADHGCSQVCFKGAGNQPTCACFTGYELQSDGKTCKGEFLLFFCLFFVFVFFLFFS